MFSGFRSLQKQTGTNYCCALLSHSRPPGGAAAPHITCTQCAGSEGSQVHLLSQRRRTWLWAPGRSSLSGDGRRAAETETDRQSGPNQEKLLGTSSVRLRLTHLSTVDVVQHKVELVCGLEGVVQPHQERVLDVLHQHTALSHDVLLL